MDIQKALQKIDEVLRLVNRNRLALKQNKTREVRLLDDQIRQLIPGIKRIASAAGWNRQGFVESAGWVWSHIREDLLRLKGQLASSEEIEAIIGPRGPTLWAQRLHEWVWDAAASLWDDSHYWESVRAAAIKVDIHLQAKLGRNDLSGTKLVREAFSVEPAQSGRPRLRFDGFEEGSQTFKDAHVGASDFGAGCMMAIRNIVIHTADKPEESMALEQLAALSVLARWIDMARVESANQEIMN